MRQLYPAGTQTQVTLVLRTDAREMTLQRGPHDRRKNGYSVAIAFPTPHDDLIGPEVEVLDAQPRALEQTKAGTVHRRAHSALYR